MPGSTLAQAILSFCQRLCVGLLVCAPLVGWDAAQRPAPAPTPGAAFPGANLPPQGGDLRPVASGFIPMPPNTPAAHSSSLLAMPAHHPWALAAFWFAGTRESAQDVRIAASFFERTTQQWSSARFVVDRHTLGEQLGFGIRRLGNPVAWLDAEGKIHLFVVATGLGGWAAARIVHLRQRQDGGEVFFDALRVLPLSWLWNTSHLVRTAPLPLQDGGMLLPIHFELGIKYPLALRFDAHGEFLGMTRISRRKHLLQPTLLMATETKWFALMRDQRPQGKVNAARTTDGGQSWTDLPDLALDNPDSSLAALAVERGRMYLAHNSSKQSRNILDLSASSDGQTWHRIHVLAHGSGIDEYSYPAMTWADGSLWVSYTDQRRRIAWQRFAMAPGSDEKTLAP